MIEAGHGPEAWLLLQLEARRASSSSDDDGVTSIAPTLVVETERALQVVRS